MYLFTIILPFSLLLTTHLTSALPNPLEPRSNYAWIGSSASPGCDSKLVGPRPKLRKGDCVKFSMATDNVHVFFGYADYGVDCVDSYADEECKVKAGQDFNDGGRYLFGEVCPSVPKLKGWIRSVQAGGKCAFNRQDIMHGPIP